MPQSQYLQSADYANYGVSGTNAQQVAAASVLIDAYLMRPEGLLYSVDGNGLPGWMTAKDPDCTLALAAPISPGQNVPATFTAATQPTAAQLQVGAVLILDRANAGIAEPVVVASNTNGAVTFQSVSFAHSANATADWGLVVEEERVLPQGRPKGRISHWPLRRLISGKGRYGFGRRGSGSAAFPLEEFNLLAVFQKFGGPPQWEQMNVSLVAVEPQGDFWIPAGIMLAYYTRVYLAFVAGWTYASLPPEIKQATANIINNTGAQQIPGNIKSIKAGDTQITKFASSVIDDDTKAMINRYRVRQFI
jgi:hypothetical protein